MRAIILAIIMTTTSCTGARLETFVQSLRDTQTTACVEVYGGMQAGAALVGGSVAVKAIATTGGADIEMCYELLR